MISVDDDLLSRVDRVRELLHAQAPAPDVEDRSALISHLLRLWLLEKGERPSEDPDRALVPATEEAPPSKSLQDKILDILKDEFDPVPLAVLRALLPEHTMKEIKNLLSVLVFRKEQNDFDAGICWKVSESRPGPTYTYMSEALTEREIARHREALAKKAAQALITQPEPRSDHPNEGDPDGSCPSH